MTDSGSRFNAWNGRVFHTGIDQTCSSARDQKVNIIRRSHKFCCAVSGSIVNQIDGIVIQACIAHAFL